MKLEPFTADQNEDCKRDHPRKRQYAAHEDANEETQRRGLRAVAGDSYNRQPYGMRNEDTSDHTRANMLNI